jgi:hypothetical protein
LAVARTGPGDHIVHDVQQHRRRHLMGPSSLGN